MFTDAHFKSTQEAEGSGFLKDYTATMEIPFDPSGKKDITLQYYFGPNQYRLLQSMDKYSSFFMIVSTKIHIFGQCPN